MLKNIVLHSAATDNAGGYHDAGSELAIGDDAEDGVISAGRAQELIDGHRAVSKTVADALERDAAVQADQTAEADASPEAAAPVEAGEDVDAAAAAPKPRRTRAG